MHEENIWTHWIRALGSIWKLLVAAALTGVFAGLLGAAFYRLIDWATNVFRTNALLVWLLPAGGALTVFLYRRAGDVGDTNRVLEGVRGEARVSPLMVPLICCGTFLTRLFGGSVGTEGAALQAGGGLAELCGDWLGLTGDQRRIVLMSGLSAGFAAIIGTPVTAIILAIEIAGVGVMYYGAILPCAISSAVSYAIASSFGSAFPHFAMGQVPKIGALPILQVIALAALCGLTSVLLCFAIRGMGQLKPAANPYLRVLAGGLMVAFLTQMLHTTIYGEGGLILMNLAAEGDARGQDFLLKIAFTAITLGTGMRGGAIEPTLAIGASFGGFMGPLLGLPAAVGAGVGMSAVFCGAINCPITSFVLGLETFGIDGSLYILLGCAVSYVCSGYVGLYPAQKIWQGKYGSLKRLSGMPPGQF